MTLTKYLTLMPKGITATADKYAYIQEAYETVVKKLRLDPSVHPLRFTNHIKLDNFNYKGELVVSQSEIAFKQFNGFVQVDDLETDQNFGTVGTALIGNLDSADYDYTDFDQVNEYHNTVPIIYRIGTSIVCTMMDDTFFLINAYVYPYFCTTSNGQYIDRHYYNVNTMQLAYGADNLTVDPVIGVLTLMMINSKYYEDNGSLNMKDIFHKYTMDLINIINQWDKTKGNDNLDYVGQLNACDGFSG